MDAYTPKTRKVFVVVSQKENYFKLFENRTLSNGDKIIVDQAPWVDIEITSFPDTLLISIRPNRNPFPDTHQHEFRTFQPDIILLRSYALGNHEHDWRRKIYALYHNNVVCVNSIDSFVWSVEKAALYGKLRRVKQKMPDFPLIQQTYYSHPSCGSFPPDFPAVTKVGSSSQGIGKSKVTNMDAWKDTLSLLSMTTEYFITEPYVNWKSDIRVQKIGNKYRAIERTKMSDETTWKANDAVGIREKDVALKENWKRWLDAAAQELDMDICGMDLIVDENGKEYILELNSSSIGLPVRHAEEDTEHICNVVIQKLNAMFCGGSTVEKKLLIENVETTTTKKKEKHEETEKKDKKKKKKDML